jgi:hypothetical protein
VRMLYRRSNAASGFFRVVLNYSKNAFYRNTVKDLRLFLKSFSFFFMKSAFGSLMIVILLFAINQAKGQDLTGKWEGYLNHVSCIQTTQQLKVVLNLTKAENNFIGTIGYYLVLTGTDINNHAPIFEFPVSTTLQGQSMDIGYLASQELHGNFFAIGYYIMGRYSLLLDYKKVGETEALEGLYRGGNGGKGLLRLRRQSAIVSASQSNSSIIASIRKNQQNRRQELQKDSVKLEVMQAKPVWTYSDSLGKLYAREQLSVQKMQIRKDSLFAVVDVEGNLPFITLELFDNAEIDGDSISIFLDEVLVVHNMGLSAKPITYTVFKPVNGIQLKVRIVAENMGSIPPNTALVQIISGKETKRLLMQADEQSNGSIVFNWAIKE